MGVGGLLAHFMVWKLFLKSFRVRFPGESHFVGVGILLHSYKPKTTACFPQKPKSCTSQRPSPPAPYRPFRSFRSFSGLNAHSAWKWVCKVDHFLAKWSKHRPIFKNTDPFSAENGSVFLKMGLCFWNWPSVCVVTREKHCVTSLKKRVRGKSLKLQKVTI
jgi:hypothetical protein